VRVLKRLLLSGLAILIAWSVIDVLMHRLLLRAVYEQNASLWRPFDQLNVVLIYIVTFTLIATFVLTYWLLVRPKSLRRGLAHGALIGLALGIASGFGTYIHMPIPLSLALGWLVGGFLKGIAAGGIIGALMTGSSSTETQI
jgi:hypothetical protein